jgi:RHH-type proline utilization regulon transcriptional repressor/proline dehydrogenase/delta 1-pyrroline-5-carboxylate dehydrogenase
MALQAVNCICLACRRARCIGGFLKLGLRVHWLQILAFTSRYALVKKLNVYDFLKSGPDTDEPMRAALNQAYHADEETLVMELLKTVRLTADESQKVTQRAEFLIREVRERKAEQGVLEAFMQEYDLSSEEGVVLMCLAEALLRIPDDDTAEKLISDKLGDANWESHVGRSRSILVNASTWGLMLTG